MMPKATRRNTDGITIASLFFSSCTRRKTLLVLRNLCILRMPSLSKQLMELEQELGKQLFIRGKRKITLTEEGVLLRKRADEILMLCEKTRREIAQDSDLIGRCYFYRRCHVNCRGTGNLSDSGQVSGSEVSVFNGDAETLMERLDHGTLDLVF